MSRLNATFIVYSVLFFCCFDFCVAKSVKVTKESTVDHYTRLNKPTIVQAKDEILVIDLPLNNTISFMSIDGVKINICNYPIPSGSSYRLPLDYAVALGNGKIVVHNLISTNPGYSDLYIIVDPWDCSSIKTIEIETYFHIEDKAMVPYYDTFDLFYENKTFLHNPGFSVCRLPWHLRYNDQGESIKLKHQLGPDIASFFRIISTMASENGRMVLLKHLDSNFQIVKESIMGSYSYSMVTGHHGVNLHSIASITNDSISVCVKNNEQYRVSVAPHCTSEQYKKSAYCEFFDVKDGNRRAFVEFNETDGDLDIDVVDLPDGGAAIVRVNYPVSGAEYYLHRVYNNGTMTEAVGINFPGKTKFIKMFPLKGSEICLVVKSAIEPAYTDDNYNLRFTYERKVVNISTKCIAVFSI